MSDKQAARIKERRILRAASIAAGLIDCEIKWEGVCTGGFAGWHHLLKLSAGGKDTLDNMVRACNPCNSAVEDHPKEAQRLGWVRKESK